MFARNYYDPYFLADPSTVQRANWRCLIVNLSLTYSICWGFWDGFVICQQPNRLWGLILNISVLIQPAVRVAHMITTIATIAGVRNNQRVSYEQHPEVVDAEFPVGTLAFYPPIVDAAASDSVDSSHVTPSLAPNGVHDDVIADNRPSYRPTVGYNNLVDFVWVWKCFVSVIWAKWAAGSGTDILP